jgi:hypothetical protein
MKSLLNLAAGRGILDQKIAKTAKGGTESNREVAGGVDFRVGMSLALLRVLRDLLFVKAASIT